jgi:hypothetical protein
MPKQTLRNLGTDALAVALDHLEENGPSAALPDPNVSPGDCVYLKLARPDQIETLAARLPHANVRFKTMGSKGRHFAMRKVFSKAAILHILRLLFPTDQDFMPYLRDLGSVDHKYWKVM